MIVELSILIAIVPIVFAFWIRPRHVPQPDPIANASHLHDRKAAIHESLRDLQFEYRLGKLSDADYQSTKLSLQKELAHTLLEIEKT